MKTYFVKDWTREPNPKFYTVQARNKPEALRVASVYAKRNIPSAIVEEAGTDRSSVVYPR